MASKKLKINLFGEEVVLDYGFYFSANVRRFYPNFAEVMESQEIEQLMLISIFCALPKEYSHIKESDLALELRNLEDPSILSDAVQMFQNAMSFFVQALSGMTKAAIAVADGVKRKKFQNF